MISILNSALYEIMFTIPFIKINNNTYVLLYRCLKLKLIELQSDQMQQTERPVKNTQYYAMFHNALFHNSHHCAIIIIIIIIIIFWI